MVRELAHICFLWAWKELVLLLFVRAVDLKTAGALRKGIRRNAPWTCAATIISRKNAQFQLHGVLVGSIEVEGKSRVEGQVGEE
jgi:hypothetical protein